MLVRLEKYISRRDAYVIRVRKSLRNAGHPQTLDFPFECACWLEEIVGVGGGGGECGYYSGAVCHIFCEI